MYFLLKYWGNQRGEVLEKLVKTGRSVKIGIFMQQYMLRLSFEVSNIKLSLIIIHQLQYSVQNTLNFYFQIINAHNALNHR